MPRTLVGICAYGGLRFLKLGIEALKKEHQYSNPGIFGFDVLVIVAKPLDTEMLSWLFHEEITFKVHHENKGFPAAINDMYDAAFKDGAYENLIVMGNDVIPMPNAIGNMIQCAQETSYEMVCGSEFDVRFLHNRYPEVRQHFDGPNLIVKPSAIEGRVWETHKDFHEGVEPDTRKDIRNLTLFKRSAFEKVGYADVSFWPNGYFEDNDYGRRCDILGVSACGLKQAAFFHWWSRTVHEGEGRDNGKYFRRNEQHYKDKWDGNVKLNIESRSSEPEIINHWANL